MKQDQYDHPEVSLSSHPTPRRPFLRAIAGTGVIGTFGLPALSGPATACTDESVVRNTSGDGVRSQADTPRMVTHGQ